MALPKAIPHRGDDPRGLWDHQLIAIILELAGLPPLTAQELSRALFEGLKSLPGILLASQAELTAFQDMTEDAAELVSIYGTLLHWLLDVRARSIVQVQGLRDIYAVFMSHFLADSEEQLVAFLTDDAGAPAGFLSLARGSHFDLTTSARKTVEQMIRDGARRVYLAHNHPDGIPVFSQADYVSTLRLAQVVQRAGGVLADHLLAADLRMYSLRTLLEMEDDELWPPPDR